MNYEKSTDYEKNTVIIYERITVNFSLNYEQITVAIYERTTVMPKRILQTIDC